MTNFTQRAVHVADLVVVQNREIVDHHQQDLGLLQLGRAGIFKSQGNKTFKFVKGKVDPVPATFFDDSAPAFPGRTPVRRRPRAARHVAVALDDLLGAIVTVTKEVTSLQTGGIHFFCRHYCLIDLRFCFDQMKITFARKKFSPTP